MNYFDIGAGIIILWSAWKGFSSGFVVSILSLIGLVAGVYVALYFSGFARNLLADNFNLNGMYLKTAAFAITFLGVVLGIHLLAKLLEKAFSAAALGPANKMAGAAFGVFKGALIVSVILMVINTFCSPGWLNDEVFQDSVICKPSSKVAPWFISLVKDEDMMRFIPQIPDNDQDELPVKQEEKRAE
ncbi:MAG: colicin V production protein [Bacteroidetes bacterium HGW-Bacteroidetes-22]|nr:MAG: colicin V production protein [Bacteroidetes bacterium HGW-Bacteroidetes-22]